MSRRRKTEHRQNVGERNGAAGNAAAQWSEPKRGAGGDPARSGGRRALNEERLQKILSAAGVASRRLSEELILQGRVSVNGTTVVELGTKADPAVDDIRVDGRRIKTTQRKRYVLLNKPRGYITTRSDPQGRPTVMELVQGVKEYIYPVGRLDYDSEGLLLLTNDGELAARLTHPRHEVEKVYEARVKGVPDDRTLERLARGVPIEGRRTAPARVRASEPFVKGSGEQTIVEISIHEGRHRQVRKMFEAFGHPVVRLKRVRIGPITDPGMPPGHWRELTPQEVERLSRSSGLRNAPRTDAPPQRTPRPPKTRKKT